MKYAKLKYIVREAPLWFGFLQVLLIVVFIPALMIALVLNVILRDAGLRNVPFPACIATGYIVIWVWIFLSGRKATRAKEQASVEYESRLQKAEEAIGKVRDIVCATAVEAVLRSLNSVPYLGSGGLILTVEAQIGYQLVKEIALHLPMELEDVHKHLAGRLRGHALGEYESRLQKAEEAIGNVRDIVCATAVEAVLKSLNSVPYLAAVKLPRLIGAEFRTQLVREMSLQLPMELEVMHREVARRLWGHMATWEGLLNAVSNTASKERLFLTAVVYLYPRLGRIERAGIMLADSINVLEEENKVLASGQSQIDSMTGEHFEDVIHSLFSERGYKARKTPSTGDFGVDVIADNGHEVIAIQCKRYSVDNGVGSEDIMKLKGGQSFYEATTCMLITTSYLTKKAQEACERMRIEFWDRKRTFEELERSSLFHKSPALIKKHIELMAVRAELGRLLASTTSGDLAKIDGVLYRIDGLLEKGAKAA